MTVPAIVKAYSLDTPPAPPAPTGWPLHMAYLLPAQDKGRLDPKALVEPWKISLSPRACCTSCGKGIPISRQLGANPLDTYLWDYAYLRQTDALTKMHSHPPREAHKHTHTCTDNHVCLHTIISGLCGLCFASSCHHCPPLSPLQSDICLRHSAEATLVVVTDNLSADSPAGPTPVLSRVASPFTGLTLSQLLLPPLLCGLQCSRRAQSSQAPFSLSTCLLSVISPRL